MQLIYFECSAGISAVAGMLGGLPMLLALVQDLLSVTATPITLAYVCYLKLYRLQLHYTLSMWRLMRGNRLVPL